jgi:hypothetical protein
VRQSSRSAVDIVKPRLRDMSVTPDMPGCSAIAAYGSRGGKCATLFAAMQPATLE